MSQPSPTQPPAPASSTGLGIDPELVVLLRCPVTRSPLVLEGSPPHLRATTGGLIYPIREGIPVMLAEEAQLPEGCASLEEFKRNFGR